MPRTYTMTVARVLSKARVMLGDNRGDMAFRNSDPELIGCLNDALNAAVGLNPGLFEIDATHTCVAGYMQPIVADRAAMLLDVVGVPEADAAVLTQFAPGWPTSTAGATQNWMRPEGDPLRFMVYPPAQAGAALAVRLVQSPAPLSALENLIPLPENYEPALVEYVVGRAELQDDEHVNSNRAAQLLERFAANVKALAAG